MELAHALKALSDESRLRILHLLSHGYFNVQEITSVASISQPTVSHHLRALQSAGLVKVKKEGTWSYYTLTSKEDHALGAEVTGRFLELTRSPALNGDRSVFERDRDLINDLVSKRRDRGKSFFDSVATEWRALRNEATANLGDTKDGEAYLSQLSKRLPSEGTLLDLGCGSGVLLERILPRNGKVIGVDFSQAMLDEARKATATKVAAGKVSQVEFRLGYLEHLPAADGSIDIAVACMVFHHIASPQEVMGDVARVLSPGGKLYVADLVQHAHEYMRERFADLWLGFDRHEFSRWLNDAGFDVVECTLTGPKDEVFLLEAVKRAPQSARRTTSH